MVINIYGLVRLLKNYENKSSLSLINNEKNPFNDHIFNKKKYFETITSNKILLKVKNQVFNVKDHMVDQNLTLPNKFLCVLYKHAPVYRAGPKCKKKQCVTEDEWSGDFYPPFCSGSCLFYPTQMAKLLFEAYNKSPFYWIDDVYLTGLLALVQNISHVDIRDHYDLYSHRWKNVLVTDKYFIHFPKSSFSRYKLWKNLVAMENGEELVYPDYEVLYIILTSTIIVIIIVLIFSQATKYSKHFFSSKYVELADSNINRKSQSF